ncbi:conserved hypothetical protein [Pseudomonas sp. IT-P258]
MSAHAVQMTRGLLAAVNVLGQPGSLSAASLLLGERLSDKSLCHLGLRPLSEEIEVCWEKSYGRHELCCQLLSQLPSMPLHNK